MEILPVNHLKQWLYCPRVVFYHQFLPQAAVPTAKMELGASEQPRLEELEARRSFQPYNWPPDGVNASQVRRLFNRWYTSTNLGLSGRPDLVLSAPNVAAVVDFKLTSGEPMPNHVMQLAAYALLVEEALSVPVAEAFVYRIQDGQVFAIEMTAQRKQDVIATLMDIQNMLHAETFPDATDHRKRCEDCEYANYCGDSW